MRNLIIFVLSITILGCESNNKYAIDKDPMLMDLKKDVDTLTGELNTLKEEIDKVSALLTDPGQDLDSEIRDSIRREINEGKELQRILEQNLDYYKVRRKKRFKSLSHRKGKEKDFGEVAKKEAKDYLYQKSLKPLKKPWLNRYRTAIDL